MSNIDIREIELRIRNNEKKLKDLDREYLRAFAPEGYKGGTSYNDFDTIHGSRKEYRIEEYAKEKERLETLIKLDKKILESMTNDIDENEYLGLLKTNRDKVKFLRKVCGYTQAQAADKLGISTRTVQNIEKEKNMQ